MNMKIPYLICLLALSGCYTQQKATRAVLKAGTEYPAVLSGICGDMYPPIASVKDSIIYKPGAMPEPVFVYVDCDTVNNKRKTLRITCPQGLKIDTVKVYKEVTKVDNAKSKSLEIIIDKLMQEKHTLLFQRKALIVLLSLFTMFFVIKYFIRTIF